MLNDNGAKYRYREYTEQPLSVAELNKVLKMLGMTAKDVLRKNDKAYKELELSGDETNADLIKHMAAHPTLLQRPIGVRKGNAVVGRPIENLLELL